jgi:hypothetical protein
MSRGARWTLGVFSLLFSWIFIISSGNSPRPVIGWMLAAFCILIAIACFSGAARGPAIRVIGAVVFVLYCGYLVLEIRKGLWRPYGGRGSEHWVNALWGLFVYGLPSLYVAIRGFYPPWGKGAEAFRERGEMPADGKNQRT